MKIKTIALFVMALLMACGNKNEDELKVSLADIKTNEIKSTILNTKHDESSFKGMRSLSYVDGLIIAARGNAEYLLEIINLKNNKVTGFIRKGRGPNEFSHLPSLSIDSKNKQLYAKSDNKWHVYDIEKLKKENYEPSKVFSVGGGNDSFSDAAYCGDGFIFGQLNYYKDFGLYDISKKELLKKTIADYGLGSENGERLYSHPNEKKAVLLGSVFSTLSIIGFKDENIKLLESKQWDISMLKTIKKGGKKEYVNSLKNQRMTFLHSAVTSKYIYALYSGKKLERKDIEEYMKTNDKNSFNRMLYSNLVFVFDWNGHPIKQYKLDKNARSICVNGNNNTLYAGIENEEGELQIAKFELK